MSMRGPVFAASEPVVVCVDVSTAWDGLAAASCAGVGSF
jgi:hypothetical protein